MKFQLDAATAEFERHSEVLVVVNGHDLHCMLEEVDEDARLPRGAAR